MGGTPNTISDALWDRLQRAAAAATGGLVTTAAQRRKAQTWADQRGRASQN